MTMLSGNNSSQLDMFAKVSPAEIFLHQLSGQDKEPDLIMLDHSYAKPWNAHPDSNHARPARMLFMKGFPRHHNLSSSSDQDAHIDVRTFTPKPLPPYDNIKSRHLINECERYVSSIRINECKDDWEEHIKRTGWTLQQNRLFNKIIKVLQSDKLARLAYEGTVNEPVLRKLAVDRTTRRIRQVFASFGWDIKLLHWLHQTLMDNVSTSYVSAYLDALQVLKSKIPTLVDKMLAVPLHSTRSGGTSGNTGSEALNQLLKRPWDPLTSLLNHHKPKKLPGTPIIVVTPSGPNQHSINQSRRIRFWQAHLSALGKVVNVTFHSVNGGNGVSVSQCLEHIIGAVRTKVLELKSHFPNRPIILLGWTVGALIACHVALVESVTCVVCLGFPLTGINGSCGDLDDPLLDSTVPTLFVIGQNANTCSIDDIEDFRERMRAESGLVIVGGADDLLRVSRVKKKLEGITQAMVDRCLVDEVGDFLAAVLTQPPNPSPSSTPKKANSAHENVGQEVRRRKRRTPKGAEPAEITPVKRRPRATGGRQSALSPLISKASTSSSSTDTSSTGSSGSENVGANVMPETPKKGAGRRPGRPPSDVQRKRKMPKNTFPKTEEDEAKPKQPLTASTPVVSDSLATSSTSVSEETERGGGGLVKCGPSSSTLSPAKSPRSLSLSIGSLSSIGHFRQTKALAGSSHLLPKIVQKNSSPKVSNSDNISQVPVPISVKSDISGISVGHRTQVPVSISVKSELPSVSVGHRAQVSVPISAKSDLSSMSVGTSTPVIQHLLPSSPESLSTFQQLTSSPLPLPTTPTSSTRRGSSKSAAFIAFPGTTLSGMISSVVVSSTLSPSKPKVPALSSSSVVSEASSTTTPQVQPSLAPAKFRDPLVEPDRQQVEAIQKLQYHDFPLTTACLTKSTTSGIPVITQAKILTSGGLDLSKLHSFSQANLTSKTVNTPSTSQLTYQTSSSVKSSTLLLSPSGLEPATFVISGSNKSSPTKGIQVQGMILKSAPMNSKIRVPIISKVITSVKQSCGKESSGGAEYTTLGVDQAACNLSLLSAVAGTKEPIKDSSQELLDSAQSTTSLADVASFTFESVSSATDVINPKAEEEFLKTIPTNATTLPEVTNLTFENVSTLNNVINQAAEIQNFLANSSQQCEDKQSDDIHLSISEYCNESQDVSPSDSEENKLPQQASFFQAEDALETAPEKNSQTSTADCSATDDLQSVSLHEVDTPADTETEKSDGTRNETGDALVLALSELDEAPPTEEPNTLSPPPPTAIQDSDSSSSQTMHTALASNKTKVPFPTVAATRTRRIRTPRHFDF